MKVAGVTLVPTKGRTMGESYIFDTASDLGRQHVGYLEQLFDEPTMACLAGAGVRPGQRCLDLGAGGGSVTRWLADQVGPDGEVVAVDIDTDHLPARPGVVVRRHDINDGLPEEGPYDVIHARLLLLHLPKRAEIFAALVEALAPGGWLVLGETSGRPLTPLAAPTDADLELWQRIQHLSHNVVSVGRGISWEWAHEVAGRMTAAGLVDVHATEHAATTVGGDAACRLHRNLNAQAEPLLLAAGATADELRRYRELMLDPRFRAWGYQFVCTRGRRPM